MNNNNKRVLLKLSVIRKILEKRGIKSDKNMAWRATGGNNQEFIDEIKGYGIIKTEKIAEVMKATDRKLYCRVAYPYVDRPYSIGYGATISAPHMHAHALEILAKNLRPNARVLDDYGIIKNDKVEDVLKATDRALYCRKTVANPYVDRPYSIGCGQTISAPHMHAEALELLAEKLTPDARVLDVGSGSGYLTACFYRFMNLGAPDSTGMVIGIEHYPELVKFSIENLNSDDPQMIESGKMKIIEGDGRKGCPEYGPYDAIHVGAASEETPDKLLKQLNKGGRMICPVGPELEAQELIQYDKLPSGVIEKKVLMDVAFVPLTDLDDEE